MRDTIDMAREALVVPYIVGPTNAEYLERLKAFEALVRADQDERYKWDIHSCGPTCKRYACVVMREAVEAEREACAKVAEWEPCMTNTPKRIAAAIRARLNT